MIYLKKERKINRICYNAAMQKIWSLSLIILIMALIAPNISFGAGLEVGPDEIYLINVPLGKKVAVSKLGGNQMKLNIKNKGAAACTFEINILPSTQTTALLSPGFTDIPDTSWIFPESKEIKIAGNSSKVVDLYIKIPKNKEFLNKNYQAVIEVKSKKNRPEELFVLACQLKMIFSTEPGGKK
jgi:hypothetical protein